MLVLRLSFLACLLCADVSFSKLSQSSADIRSLFFVPPGTQLDYPPTDVPGPKPRDVWVEAYQRAKKAGRIPSIPKSEVVDYRAKYPSSYKGHICNPGLNACNSTVDVISAPPGTAGISFDDGPQPPSLELLDFLKSRSQKATHFLIGSRILDNPDVFQALDDANEHLAVHTYSHPMMTSLSDLEVVGELGWTMQVIHDYSRENVICAYWRPSYGDTDQRVQAIAKHVFGLRSILWLFDPKDWCLADSAGDGSVCGEDNGPQNLNDLKATLNEFAHSRKQDGLIILEHEQSHRAVAGFKFVYPVMKQLQWITKAIPDLFHAPWYQ